VEQAIPQLKPKGLGAEIAELACFVALVHAGRIEWLDMH
jgi:hypothetical protein